MALLIRPDLKEAALWRRWLNSKDFKAREELFELYTHLARSIARNEKRRRPNHGADGDDLLQLAFGGLLEAIDRFDPERGIPFSAYARMRMKGSISDGAAKFNEHAATHQFNRRNERLASITSNQNSPESKTNLQKLSDIVICLSIGLIADSVTKEVNSVVEEDHFTHPFIGSGWRDLQISVMEYMLELEDPAKTVLQRHYLDEVSFTQIADLMAVSKARVSQIHRHGLELIRKKLEGRKR
ncbi:sigma-70 family RNA polymerase sigma factor [Candidatus Phycosocius spiralis]|uniref:RNA polymerase sigma factor n=1 Tax=Candidatus Phycosocius spiralis TaxID=2815099 RepID=A0ABQ4PYQ3_9PROT|nr:sigma-70 family RNA polymerase sigma factor [Candidatus Phycosocius spiralis]GIU68045.1 RNA polymerase sigma factor [Candidatus Phycosocius spiralis]